MSAGERKQPRPSFFSIEPAEKKALFDRAALEMGIAAAILEKDVWVCFVLKHLFGLNNRQPMVFKGGTSLSKVHRAIDRFSEDIDITVDWVGLDESLPDPPSLKGLSRTKIRQVGESIHEHLFAYVATLVPRLLESLKQEVDQIEIAYEKNEEGKELPDALRVSYPGVADYGDDYLKPSVLIEFGARNPVRPNEQKNIEPDVASKYQQIDFPVAPVDVLAAERTFWEKATLIHDECHRPEDKKERPKADRRARHLFDLAKLADHSIGQRAMKNLDLLRDVVDVKDRFFRYGYSRYDLCCTGQMKLVPEGVLLEVLRADYQKMVDRKMFYSAEVRFDDIIARLRTLQEDVNRLFVSK